MPSHDHSEHAVYVTQNSITYKVKLKTNHLEASVGNPCFMSCLSFNVSIGAGIVGVGLVLWRKGEALGHRS